MNQTPTLLPWIARQHHDSDSFNFCANALRECFQRNGGTISRQTFRRWCLRYGQNPSRVQIYFEAVGMAVALTTRRRSDHKGRRRCSDRFTWRLADEAR